MHHVYLEKDADYIGNIHVASLHCINDSGYHQALLRDCGGARIFLCCEIPLYYSIATSLGLDGTIPFLLQEHQTGHRGPTILSDELLRVVWLQGVHCDQMAHLILNNYDSALTKELQDLLNVILSHDDLCCWS